MNQMHKKLLLATVASLLILITIQAQAPAAKIAATLLEDSQNSAEVECLILFRNTADLNDLSRIHGKERKGRLVYERLQTVSRESQQEVQRIIGASGRPFQSFLIVNALHTRLDRELLLRIAARPEVLRIQANPWIDMLAWRPLPGHTASGRSPVEWGLDLINVPEVWAQGIRGTGVVIGNQDTGVEWTHPTLKEKYRGWQGSEAEVEHSYNWFDAITEISPLHNDEQIDPSNNPCGLSVDFPCDDNDHGTYTMGISVGDDEQGNQIGVAPASRWIACRNMERGYGSPATYLAGFEWFLAPTDLDGNDPRPELAPHVINNSWGCPAMEGCSAENWGILEQAVENLRAAGVVVVVSAGNDGPDCGSVNDPSAIFAGSFAVGATNATDTLAGFSSRGPVTIDGSGRIKPDLVAPGVNIRSARRNDGFMAASGTSAAGPFVTGIVALIIEANPDLAGEVALIEQIMRESTVPAYDRVSCGGYSDTDVPNPMTGYGRIDALAAVERARQVSPVNTPRADLGIEVYPNPSRGLLRFTSDTNSSGSVLEIFDSTGKLVERKQVNQTPFELDLTAQPAGLYWWRWNIDGHRNSGRIVKF
ncbi:S8 family peptidase [Flavilitoribacter nigricans]|uniref:Peptidase S8 n=1 Tax=Flavilitoribacter nigricans (strain ATCC 23147 / DSM 23189 / NBRC 102662 / NCIMB 1420 / SS-2) TaxID=1122177 RepID=A0A2D0MZN4_FLAN2|nr:S8 family peptidase [Flavilitoribacter nigricans]PHN01677.1 peptidase S8 [Flavilitoribacter nigricans DSM 23189 = NBRC 102662]